MNDTFSAWAKPDVAFPAGNGPVPLTEAQIRAVAGAGRLIHISVPSVAAAGAVEPQRLRPDDGPPGSIGDRTS